MITTTRMADSDLRRFVRAGNPLDYAASLFSPTETGILIGTVFTGEDWAYSILPAMSPNFVTPVESSWQIPQTEFRWHRILTDMRTRISTRLLPDAPYPKVKLQFEPETGAMKFYGAAAEIGLQEKGVLVSQLPAGWRAQLNQAARTVSIDFQNIVASVLTTSGNFGTVTAIGAGDEWDLVGVEMREQVEAAADRIFTATGVGQSRQSFYCTVGTWRAMRNNSHYVAYLTANVQGGQPRQRLPGASMWEDPILAEYLGVARVLVWEVDPGVSLGDRAWLAAQPLTEASALLQEEGEVMWGATMQVNTGLYLPGYEEPDTRREFTPFIRGFEHVIMMPEAAELFTNTSSTM